MENPPQTAIAPAAGGKEPATERSYRNTILVTALILRLGMAWLLLSAMPPNWFFDAAQDLGYLAHSLASGQGLSDPFGGPTGPSAIVTPGYPLLIALIFKIFGSYTRASIAAIVTLQTGFSVLTVAAIMHVARRFFDARTANLAGLIWAVSPPLLWLPVFFWETSLSTLLLTGAAVLAMRIVDGRGRLWWPLAGLYCGLSLLVNPALVPAMAAILLWAAFQARPRRWREPLAGLLAMLLVFAPWPIRNLRTMHAPILLRSSFGYELWLGNREGADGLFEASVYPLKSRAEYDDYAARGEVAYMRGKTALAESYIRAHPGLFLLVTCKRIARFWAGAGSALNLRVVEIHAVATLIFGCLGLGFLLRKRAREGMLFLLPLLFFPLPYYITDVKFRYRLVVDPFLTILAAYALVRLTQYAREKQRRA